MSRLGHEPAVVAATFPGEPEQKEFIERYAIDGVPVIRFDRNAQPNTSIRDTYDLPKLETIHRQILEEIRPDIVHVCHLLNHSSALLDTTRRMGLPTVATFTDFFGFCFNNKLNAVDGSLCKGPSRSRSNCIACCYFPADGGPSDMRHRFARAVVPPLVSTFPQLAPRNWRAAIADLKARPGHLASVYRTYAAALTPTRFLMNSYRSSGMNVPLELSRFGIDIDRAAKPPGPDGMTRLGFIGQLAHHKGLHLLLAALRQVGGEGFSLDIYGDETMDPAYAAHIRSLSEGLPVAFRGTFPLERTAEVLRGMDALVIPSTWVENSPLILLQALATHTPVLISDVEGMSEFVEEERNGFSFAKGSVPSLADRLARFAREPGLARAMSLLTHYDRSSRDMAMDVVGFYGRTGARAAGAQKDVRDDGRRA